MTVTVIKAERVVRTMLGLLERDVVLPRLVWRDAGGDFRGAKGDAITIRLPAYSKSRKRSLRSGASRTKDNLQERKVTVNLTDDLYNVIPITDEELTLDLESFDQQITAPVASGLVRGVEDEIIDRMVNAPYVGRHKLQLDTESTFKTVTRARKLLNNARVPMEGRALAIGADMEEHILNDPQFVRADQSGSTQALREAEIGRVAGFPVFTVPGLPPNKGYAFHRTAYVLSTRAPFVPRGVPWGASLNWGGFALRVAQAVDPDELVDNFHADAWTGTNYVPDFGEFVDQDGSTVDESGSAEGNPAVFEPYTTFDEETDKNLFVRAVEITLGEDES